MGGRVTHCLLYGQINLLTTNDNTACVIGWIGVRLTARHSHRISLRAYRKDIGNNGEGRITATP